jgi:hypothetical protein
MERNKYHISYTIGPMRWQAARLKPQVRNRGIKKVEKPAKDGHYTQGKHHR